MLEGVARLLREKTRKLGCRRCRRRWSTAWSRCALGSPSTRSTAHFTPTSCSWVNAVETFLDALRQQRLRPRLPLAG
jgi:hypothetical protein